MPWTLIDTAIEDETTFELYAKDGVHMIRANGFELMNGFSHESEIALGLRAAALACGRAPRVLIGGLGLGYTAAAMLEALAGRGHVTVAELSHAVIAWFDRYVRAMVLPMLPRNLSIVHADVADLLTSAGRYDAIVLDVDNGPEPLVTARNGSLYTEEGLRRLRAALSDDGAALLWSGFESPAFAAAATALDFAVTCEPFQRMDRPDLSHFIYVLRKLRAASGAVA
jgi:spermidine synthase